MLLDGEYQPLYESDLRALGQLGLVLAGGKQPDEHIRLQQLLEYVQEMRLGIQDLTRTPGHKACAQYLMALSSDPNTVNYGDQVNCTEPYVCGKHALRCCAGMSACSFGNRTRTRSHHTLDQTSSL